MYLNYNIDTNNMPKKGNDSSNSLISLSKQAVINNALATRMPSNPAAAPNAAPQPAGGVAPATSNNGWGRTHT